eukprot:3641622-Amphidinium_carterae.1
MQKMLTCIGILSDFYSPFRPGKLPARQLRPPATIVLENSVAPSAKPMRLNRRWTNLPCPASVSLQS